jgi:hypothetical protein
MLITNFHEREKEKYIKAVNEYKKRTGNTDIYVDNNAYVNGHKLENHGALRCKSFENANIFYSIQDELELIGTDVNCTNKQT